MWTATRTNAKRKCLSLRELREHYLEQGKIMSGPFKNIDITYKTDQHGGYYNAVDFAGRAWKITNFSLSGIWVLWPVSTKREPIYVHSLWDADVILGGGVVKEKEIRKPQRTTMPQSDNKQYYTDYTDYRMDEVKQQLEEQKFRQRCIRRNSVPGQFSAK